MTKVNSWWHGVKADMIGELAGKLHPGALKYYAEAGIPVPASLK
jgi:hypothetical protein